MTNSRPYLLRAIYDWIVDNGLTPYLLVNATVDKVEVPTEFVANGKIILNIAPAAVKELEITNNELHFNARFSGQPKYVYVPVQAAMAIYAKENGRGMVFTEEDDFPPGPEAGGSDSSSAKSRQPNLRVVK